MGTNKVVYLVIDNKNIKYIRKYLAKVEELTSIKQNTLSKHFNNGNSVYKNDNFEVIKIINVDLSSNSRGNKYNFIKSLQEWE